MKESLKIQAEKYSEQLGKASAEEVLAFFLDQYKGKIVQATSMGSEDQVITSMICSLDKNTRIITLDTGRMFQETYDLIAQTNNHFSINFEIYFPDNKRVEEMVKDKG